MFGKKGFTLIELLVVIIIVGILAAVAIPMMTGQTKRAAGSEGVAIAGTVRTAERIYYAENQTYTTNLAALGLCATTDLNGRYYGSCVRIPTANATHYTIIVCGQTGQRLANGEHVNIYQNGDIDTTY